MATLNWPTDTSSGYLQFATAMTMLITNYNAIRNERHLGSATNLTFASGDPVNADKIDAAAAAINALASAIQAADTQPSSLPTAVSVADPGVMILTQSYTSMKSTLVACNAYVNYYDHSDYNDCGDSCDYDDSCDYPDCSDCSDHADHSDYSDYSDGGYGDHSDYGDSGD